MRKRHINEFLKTQLANSGRAAGFGITYDDYSENSYGGYRNISAGQVKTLYDFMTTEERVKLNGPVKIYRLKARKRGKKNERNSKCVQDSTARNIIIIGDFIT